MKNINRYWTKTTPVLITYKFFNDTVSVKREVYDLTARDLVEMNRTIVVNMFDEQEYHKAIMSLAKDIGRRKSFINRLRYAFNLM